MATFLRTKDGKNYVNLDFIEFVFVNDEKGIAYLHTTENRKLDWKGVYEISAADWLRHVATLGDPEVITETPAEIPDHRGSAQEVGSCKTPNVKTKGARK